MNGMFVEFEGERLEEGNVIRHHFLIRKIKLVHDDGVDVIVGQKII